MKSMWRLLLSLVLVAALAGSAAADNAYSDEGAAGGAAGESPKREVIR